MKTIVIILGKSFSQRVPGKNMKEFCGIPLIGWSIIQSVNSHEVDETWVTSDSEEILEYAMSLGAEPFKRRYQDTDDTGGWVPVFEIIGSLYTRGVIAADDCVVTRFCTTPTLLPHDTDESIRMYRRAHADFGVEGIGCASEFRTLITSKRLCNYDNGGISKGIPPEYHCHNNYRIVRHLAFLGTGSARGALTGPPPPEVAHLFPGFKPLTIDHEVPDFGIYYRFNEWAMTDVDTEEEFDFAQLVMENYVLKGKGRKIFDDYGRIK